MGVNYQQQAEQDTSGFVLLADYIPAIVQEIRYYSTYNFIGDRINGYEEPCAIVTRKAKRRAINQTCLNSLPGSFRVCLSFGNCVFRHTHDTIGNVIRALLFICGLQRNDWKQKDKPVMIRLCEQYQYTDFEKQEGTRWLMRK